MLRSCHHKAVTAAVAFFVLVHAACADSEAELKKKLNAEGVMVISGRAYLAAENDLTKDLKEVAKLRRELVNATKAYNALKGEIAGTEAQMMNLHNQAVQLNTQLANVTDVTTNNRLVGAINAMQGQVSMMQAQKKKLEDQETELRAKASDAREAYLTHVLGMRTLATEIQEKYETLPKEGGIKTLLDEYNQVAKTNLQLAASPTFQGSLKRLADAEASILSESIPLREEGRTYLVNVSVNGKEVKEFMVDSGASLISLPLALAKELGVEPKPEDEIINLTLADGRQVQGQLVLLSSVRVGKFTINDVECAVLGADAPFATALLGMSFLGNFKFEVNSAESTLTMTQIDTPEANVQPRKRR